MEKNVTYVLRKHRTMLAAHQRVNFSRLLPAKISITRQVTFVQFAID